MDEKLRDKSGRFKKKYLKPNKCECGKEISRYANKCKSCNNKGNKYNLGKKHSEETRLKMSNKRKGVVISREQRKKISKKNKEKGLAPPKKFWFKKGCKPWNFKGTTSLSKKLRNSEKWKIWRNAVFLRDKFVCQNKNCIYCNNKQGVFLHPHHIKPLAYHPELAFDLNNGVTYCRDYHLKSGLHKNIKKKKAGGELRLQ